MTDDDGDTEPASVDDPTADRPPEDYEFEDWGDLSDEEKRIIVFRSLEPEDRDPSLLVPDREPSRNDQTDASTEADGDTRTADGLSAETCSEIRRQMHNALTAREVVEEYPAQHTSKIMRHAYGDCNHIGVTEPPTASPQIGPNECLSMRDDYASGDSIATVAETWSRSENTVTRHIYGRCSHDTTPRDMDRVTVWECDRLRKTYHSNPRNRVEEVAAAMRFEVPMVTHHLFGYCSHLGRNSPDEPPAKKDDVAFTTDGDGRDA